MRFILLLLVALALTMIWQSNLIAHDGSQNWAADPTDTTGKIWHNGRTGSL